MAPLGPQRASGIIEVPCCGLVHKGFDNFEVRGLQVGFTE